MKKIEIELQKYEFKALTENHMIMAGCEQYLVSPIKDGDFIILQLSIEDATDLVGWVAAESNHADTLEESKILSDICDIIETQI